MERIGNSRTPSIDLNEAPGSSVKGQQQPKATFELDLPTRKSIHAEKQRSGWTAAKTAPGKALNKLAALTKLRSTHDKVKDFAEFVGSSKATGEPLEDGWMRHSAPARKGVATLDLHFDARGNIDNVRLPPSAADPPAPATTQATKPGLVLLDLPPKNIALFGTSREDQGRDAAHSSRRRLSESGPPLPDMPQTPGASLHRDAAELPLALISPDQPLWASDPKLPRNLDRNSYIQASLDKIGGILDEKELQWLRDYSNFDASSVNASARAGKSTAACMHMIDKLTANGLRSEGMLFRGLSDHRLITEGKRYMDLAPGSASVSPAIAQQHATASADWEGTTGIVLHVIGAQAGNVSGVSVEAYEAEALIRPQEPLMPLLKAFDETSGLWKALLVRDDAPPDDAAQDLPIEPESTRKSAGFLELMDSDEDDCAI
ncbi:hypothetical protein HLB44_34780 [Aquincola sp. S2]|uniref:ADP ribosyltransferase domain-containing protein n=1 Tax=Pseudaquabacterium terrae TaxID=2732868 RepID=A0ABX2EU29_9BURK|nr:hypothetical protein [Aquabacterium terrae]NRF72163.1 hypothetical protein [Aquabacterium terrae]